jgi:hypothetical protein
MAAGGPGDHPLSDITQYGLRVFGEPVDSLVRAIAQYVSPHTLDGMFNWWTPPPLDEFETLLRTRLEDLRSAAEKGGWEPNPDSSAG